MKPPGSVFARIWFSRRQKDEFVATANQVELEHPLPRKVAVFGAGGKSTLARAIAQKMNLKFIEIDWINHMPGWQTRPPEDANRILLEQMESSPNGWIADHHTGYLRELIYRNVESVIVLELPFRTIFWRRFKRSLKRAWTHEIVCGGNTETFWQHFFTRESAIYEVLTRRKRYASVFDRTFDEAPAGINFHRIRSVKQLDEFYELHGLERGG